MTYCVQAWIDIPFPKLFGGDVWLSSRVCAPMCVCVRSNSQSPHLLQRAEIALLAFFVSQRIFYMD